LNQEAGDFDFTGSNGIYQLSWPDLHVKAHVSYMKASGDHEVKGEVTFTSERPTSAGHLRNGRLNITSPSSRKSFSKSLNDIEPEVNWDSCLEQLCMSVLKEWRSGSPLIQIDGQMPAEEQQSKYLIKPLIQANNPTMIYGPGSTGKSWLAQYIAVLADSGIDHGGMTVSPETKGRVLVLDWETSAHEIGSRVTHIRRGLGLEEEPSGIWYRSMSQGLANDIERVREICIQRDIALVIMDSIGMACMGEPESAEVVLRMFSALRSLEVSSLLIDHTNKQNPQQEGQANNLFGSVYKYNSARLVWEMRKEQQENDSLLYLGLYHKKANNAMLEKPIGFKLDFSTEESVVFKRQDVREIAGLEVAMTLGDRIENSIKSAPEGLTVSELADELDKSESHIRKALSQSRGNRFVKLPSKSGNEHKYGLGVRDFGQSQVRDEQVKKIFEEESWDL
jgi:hypothetical protein